MTDAVKMTTQEFAEYIEAGLAECDKYETCMSLHVHEKGLYVELLLDTAVPYYDEWIKGEGGDICLYRCQETGKVVGCHLPLMNKKLVVHYDGPLRINEGFLKDEPAV